jgi:hypothetical protein
MECTIELHTDAHHTMAGCYRGPNSWQRLACRTNDNYYLGQDNLGFLLQRKWSFIS